MSAIEREFRLLSEAEFRDISGQFLYIECKNILEKMSETEDIRKTSTGLIVYAYIDHASGLSCQPVLVADLMGDGLRVFDLAKSDTKYIFRINEGYKEYSEQYGEIKMWMCHITPDHRFCNAEVFGNLVEGIKPFADFIDKQYDMRNPDTTEFRNNTDYDEWRSKYWPDDFQVHLFGEDNKGEVVWVRAEHYADPEYIGELLNEPYQDFGIHKGDMIGFKEHQFEDGELILYSTLRVWVPQNLS